MIECKPGTATNEVKMTSCPACPAGKYTEKSGEEECDPCIGNQYQNEAGKTGCKVCDADTFSPEEGGSKGPKCADTLGPCTPALRGNGICNRACNRFDAKDADYTLIGKEESLDMGDCSAEMARLIAKSHMMLQVRAPNERVLENAGKLLKQVQAIALVYNADIAEKCNVKYTNIFPSTSTMSSTTTTTSAPPTSATTSPSSTPTSTGATSPTSNVTTSQSTTPTTTTTLVLDEAQCNEYSRQRDFHAVAEFMLRGVSKFGRPDTSFVAEGASGWEEWIVSAF